ncbi:MAG: hypothetical protein ACKOTD_01785 [Phycisphaerales bacterium]
MIHALRRLPGQRKAVLALLSVIALAAGAAAAMRRAPAWWQPTPRDAVGALEVARALEQGIASETTRVRGPGAQPWSVRVRAADVNAWLGARLPQWLEHDRSLPWPEGVQAVQAAADAHGFTLAADWNGFVVSTRWAIEPGVPGQPATLRAAGTSVGSLPIPFASGVGAWFVPELGQPLPLESRLGDGRRVRIVGAEFADGEAILDCETATAP